MRNPSRQVSHKKRAFVLSEVLVAMFVLTIGIVAVLAIITKSYQDSRNTVNMIIASELAQEGAELARNARDNALAEGYTGPNVFLAFPTGGQDQKCIMGYGFRSHPATSSINCTNPGAYILNLRSGNIYGYGAAAATPTHFYRALRIDHSPNTNEARVRSFVAWQDPGTHFINDSDLIPWCTVVNKCVYTELYLTSWKY